MFKKFLEWLGSKLPKFTIPQDDGTPYLTRHYLLGKDRERFNIYLHKFHASDSDTDPSDNELLYHNHPFLYSFSIILAGGYVEFKIKDGKQSVKILNPLSFNFINKKIFHRVELISETVWTIFFTGPRLKNWYFLNSKTNKQYHHSFKEKSIA